MYINCVSLSDINNSSHLSESLKEFEADLHLPSSDDFGLQHVSYNNSRLVDVVYGHLNNTQFTGITVSRCELTVL